MSVTLELFLQGGLGNQLIQKAYAENLASYTGIRLVLNPLLISPGWAAFHNSKYHLKHSWSTFESTETRLSLLQLLYWLRFKWTNDLSFSLHDGISNDHVLSVLCDEKLAAWIPMLGYFQRAQAFESLSQGFWWRLVKALRCNYQLNPYPISQVAVHVRLGDYLLPQNQRIYASSAIDQQLSSALLWRQQMGDSHPLNIFTDDPVAFASLCPAMYRSEIRLLSSTDPHADFLALACHRRIVVSNSTYSLCASKVSSLLWREPLTAMVPRKWYREPFRNAQQQLEWNKLDFICDFWP